MQEPKVMTYYTGNTVDTHLYIVDKSCSTQRVKIYERVSRCTLNILATNKHYDI